MRPNEQILAKLSEIWGKCLVDYHKSNDPHFLITEDFCFGDVSYRAEHNGYIYESYNQIFNTRAAAENYLIGKIKEQITEECNHQLYAFDHKGYEINKDPAYWKDILEEVKNLNIPPAAPENFEEKYLTLLKQYNNLKYHADLTSEFLDSQEIEYKDDNVPDMEYSLNYRVELLAEKLKNQLSAAENREQIST